MNDVMISNLVFVNNYNIPTSARSSKAPKQIFLQSLGTGLDDIAPVASGLLNNPTKSVHESQKLVKKDKSSGNFKKTLTKKPKQDKHPDFILSQRLITSGLNMDFLTSSHSKLPRISGNNVKKAKIETNVPKTQNLKALISSIKSKSIQKRPLSRGVEPDKLEKSSSRSKISVLNGKGEAKPFKTFGDHEFISSHSKLKYNRLSPRDDFDILVKKLKFTCKKSHY